MSSKVIKTLNNVYSASSTVVNQLAESIIKKLSAGGVVLEDIEISGGAINSTPLGANGPSNIYATTLQTGNQEGDGYDVVFYGDTIGESFEWDSTLGIVNISGGLVVNQTVDFGNIRISGNTITSTNTNGDIILDPAGSGSVIVDNLIFGNPLAGITGSGSDLEIYSSGQISLQGDTNIIGQFTLDDRILTLAQNTTVADNRDRGIEYVYNDGKLGFFGYDDTDGYFTYIPDATNTDDVISGDIGNVKFNTGSFNSIVIDNSTVYNDGVDLHLDSTGGNVVIDTNTTISGDLTVTGNVNFTGGATTNLTVERLNIVSGNVDSPSNGSNVTFINITGSGVATGTMPVGVTDGFFKNICISHLDAGCSYELTFPIGTMIDPVSGTKTAKKMVFDTSGQGVQLIWDNTESVYLITQGGAEILPV